VVTTAPVVTAARGRAVVTTAPVVTAALVTATLVTAAAMVAAAARRRAVVVPAAVPTPPVGTVVAGGGVADADDVDAVAAHVHRRVDRYLDVVAGADTGRAGGVSAGVRAP
jgi:hypothetical protein